MDNADYSKLLTGGRLRLNYTSDLNFVTGNIYECDITKANLMILTKNLDQLKDSMKFSEVQTLLRFLDDDTQDKKNYQIFIGKLMRDYRWLSPFIHDYYRFILGEFIRLNEIRPDNILSIKKDAIFLVGVRPGIEDIEGFEVRCKGKYDTYYYFEQGRRKVEVYGTKDNVTVKNLIGGRNRKLVEFIHKELISKILPLDKKYQYHLIERFERDFLNGKYLDDVSIYGRTDGRISLSNGYAIKPMGLDEGFVSNNVNLKSYYDEIVRPMIQTFIRGFWKWFL